METRHAMISTRLLDDQVIVRAGLGRIVSKKVGFEVVAEHAHGRQVAEELPALRADVVLMDTRMPALDGLAATERLHGSVGRCEAHSPGLASSAKDRKRWGMPRNHGGSV
jgi:DNA-binding NarL/FixJ family response regulator